ncbi:MAG: tetratricopeptide repeat protein, partial [Bacteroidota bacterium]
MDAGFHNKKVLLIITVAVFLVYGNSIFNDYCLDDEFVVKNHPVVTKGVSGIGKIFRSRYYSGDGLSYGYRPVTQALFALEYEVFGNSPHISHLISVILFSLLCYLIYLSLRKIFHEQPQVMLLLIVFIYILHPVHTEVVASLKNRDEILGFMFALLSFLFLHDFAVKGKQLMIIPGMVLFAIAIASKLSAAPFVLAIPAMLLFSGKVNLYRLAGVFVSLLVILYLFRLMQKGLLPAVEREVHFYENPLTDHKGILNRMPTGLIGLLMYLKLLIFPHPLVFYYGYDMVPVSDFSNPWVIVSLLIHIGLFVVALFMVKKNKVLSFGILIYLILMTIFGNTPRILPGIIAERYLFAASLGFCIITGYLLYRFIKPESINIFRNFKWKYLVLMAIAVVYFGKTFSRNLDWKDSMTLFRHDIPYLENSVKANDIYATACLNSSGQAATFSEGQEMISEALMHYSRCIELCPDEALFRNDVGMIYYIHMQNYDSAKYYFSQALMIDSSDFRILMNLASVHEVTGDLKNARRYYYKAVYADRKKSLLPLTKIAGIYFRDGMADSSLLVNQQILKEFSGKEEAYISYGNYFFMDGDTTEAIVQWEKALEINPADSKMAYS